MSDTPTSSLQVTNLTKPAFKVGTILSTHYHNTARHLTCAKCREPQV